MRTKFNVVPAVLGISLLAASAFSDTSPWRPLADYPRPPAPDTGWGIHDFTDCQWKPSDPNAFFRELKDRWGFSWFKILACGANKLDMVAAAAAEGVEPVVRIYAPRPHPHYPRSGREEKEFRELVRGYVAAGAHYIEAGNEPNLGGEWAEGEFDKPGRIERLCRQWLRVKKIIEEEGGIAVFYAMTPGSAGQWWNDCFQTFEKWDNIEEAFAGAAFGAHLGPANHPLDYPFNPKKNMPHATPQQRRESLLKDNTCYRAGELIMLLMERYLPQPIPILSTEGGAFLDEQPDKNYPPVTLERHRDLNMEIFNRFNPRHPKYWGDPLFAQMSWAYGGTGAFLFSGWFNHPEHGNLPILDAMEKAEKFDRGIAFARVTTDSLLDQMIDLDRLTRWPSPAYVTKQFSSYDRASRSPSDDWFANHDRGHFLGKEENAGRSEYVMMDADGPGAIVRIWSANPSKTIRIYLDGRDRPAIEAPMGKLLNGEVEGFPVPLAGRRAAGSTIWFPIPYAEHCKVTCEADDIYYHVNYRTYEPGTSVQSFDGPQLAELADRIRTIAQKLQDPRRIGQIDKARAADRAEWTGIIEPREAQSVTLPKGPAAVANFTMTLGAKNLAAAARGLVLRMSFDGEETVECPVGDFFGSAPGITPFETLPVGMTADDKPMLWSHFRMPYRKEAKLSLQNHTAEPVRVRLTAVTIGYEWRQGSLLFHAKWRTERDLPTRPFVDWPHLHCDGRGRFVGGTLHFINPVKKWWGEGDEKIYVDGEKFPSHFGTGTEDYYSYAWGSPEVFTHAYHSQPVCDGPGTYGNTSLNRFHILDDIPFRERFRFDMENWHWNERVKVHRAATSYWYARPGGSDFFKPITPDDVRFVEVPQFGTPGVLEGEDLQILSIDGGSQPLYDDERFSGETYLRWHPEEVGSRLTFGFQVKQAGEARIRVRLARSWDFGQVQFYVNGAKVGVVVDGYVEGGGPSEEIELGTAGLKRGQNELTIECVGRSKKSKGIVFGLDYLRVGG